MVKLALGGKSWKNKLNKELTNSYSTLSKLYQGTLVQQVINKC